MDTPSIEIRTLFRQPRYGFANHPIDAVFEENGWRIDISGYMLYLACVISTQCERRVKKNLGLKEGKLNGYG